MASATSPPFRVITKTGRDSYPDIPGDHPCVVLAQQMAELHNSIIRLCNASYAQALQIQPDTQTAADFLTWNKFIVDVIHTHHHSEETEMFPKLEELAGKPGLLSANTEQHHVFERPLSRLYDYVTKTSQKDYDGATLRQLWDDVAPQLQHHLENEPVTFYQLKDAEVGKFRELIVYFQEAAKKEGDPSIGAPLLLGSQDYSFRGVDGKPQILFADMGAFAPYVVHYVLEWRHYRLWKFNPSDTWGKVKQGRA